MEQNARVMGKDHVNGVLIKVNGIECGCAFFIILMVMMGAIVMIALKKY